MNLLPSLGVVAEFESVKKSHRVLRATTGLDD